MRSLYRHYHEIVTSLYETAQYDLSKARQLLDYAHRKHKISPDTDNSKAIQMHHAIKLRIALQCVLGAIAKTLELSNVSMGSVAAVLNLGRHVKRRLEQRAEQMHLFLDEELLEALYDDRGKIRSDK
eukprot:6201485-Pleurochrysis_carterae.AAC.1